MADYIRFRAVCRDWRSSTTKVPRNLPCQLPCLMLPAPCNDEDVPLYDSDVYRPFKATEYGGDFFSLSDRKVHHIELPEVCGKLCCGSTHGWLWLVSKDISYSMSLFNPITKDQIQLPPITTLPQYRLKVMETGQHDLYFDGRLPLGGEDDCPPVDEHYMQLNVFTKLVLSENPTSNNYLALFLYGEDRQLAFCRAGDTKWRISEDLFRHDACSEAIYYKGLFYCVFFDGSLTTICNLDYHPTENDITRNWSSNRTSWGGGMKYLVEVCGQLMMVAIHIDSTPLFTVHKFRPRSKKWARVTSLGNCAVFLGMNDSFSLSAKDFPRGCKPNCIYFTDHHQDNGYGIEIGHRYAVVFNMEDSSIEPLACHGDKPHPLLIWPPPIWITPSLC